MNGKEFHLIKWSSVLNLEDGDAWLLKASQPQSGPENTHWVLAMMWPDPKFISIL